MPDSDLYSIDLDPAANAPAGVPHAGAEPSGTIGGSDVGANEQDDQRVRDLMEQHLEDPSILQFLGDNINITQTFTPTAPGASGTPCYDYVVDSGGNGTHLTVRAMMADFIIAAELASGVVKACFVCNNDSDLNIEFGSNNGNVSSATLSIEGPGATSFSNSSANSPRVKLQASVVAGDDSYFKTAKPQKPRLIFRNLKLQSRHTADTINTNFLCALLTGGGSVSIRASFYDCDFLIGFTTSMKGCVADGTNAGSGNGADLYFENCSGSVGGILRFSAGFAAGSIEMINTRNMVMFNMCSDISTSTLGGVTVRGGGITTTGYLLNNVSGNGIAWTVQGANFRHTGASVWLRYTSGQIGAGTQIFLEGINYSQSSTTIGAVTAASPAFGSNHRIFVSSCDFYADGANAATAVVVTGANWLKADRGPISGPNFAAPSSGLTAV